MQLGDEYVLRLVNEAICAHNGMAAFHFEGNLVTEAGKQAINQAFTM
jgi:hypothetical protein